VDDTDIIDGDLLLQLFSKDWILIKSDKKGDIEGDPKELARKFKLKPFCKAIMKYCSEGKVFYYSSTNKINRDDLKQLKISNNEKNNESRGL